MPDVAQITSESLAKVLKDLETETPIVLDSVTNLFDAVYSFAIVDLLLATAGRM